MSVTGNYRISSPLHLQVRVAHRHGQVMSIREHLPPTLDNDPALPLVIITYHPGLAAGSYEDRDYFELLTPLLFGHCQGRYRLRIFTINHPGYDLPHGYKIDRLDMETFSIRHQPVLIEQVLRWLLLSYFAEEQNIFLIPYGHSMGGLALARTDLRRLETAVAGQGCRLQVQKVLSAPALVLRESARQSFNGLTAIKAIKRIFGRVPLYERITQGLFSALAPTLYRLDAENYSLNPDCTFVDFRRYNPFILLDQGLELLNLEYSHERMTALLDGSHLILSNDDGMVNSEALMSAASQANGNGASVQVHTVNSSHNAERDDPHLVVDSLCAAVKPLVTAGSQPAHPAVPVPS